MRSDHHSHLDRVGYRIRRWLLVELRHAKGECGVNLSKLFELQKELYDRIVEEHNLQGQDLLPGTILALQVELGELANCWRGFKHWSNDREPRTAKMLEEYVDCLHFVLSIGLQRNIQNQDWVESGYIRETNLGTPTVQFNHLFNEIGYFYEVPKWSRYRSVFDSLIGLGTLLGFTRDEIEQAYIDKNRVNHVRQDNNY